jgi:hypothetical protein
MTCRKRELQKRICGEGCETYVGGQIVSLVGKNDPATAASMPVNDRQGEEGQRASSGFRDRASRAAKSNSIGFGASGIDRIEQPGRFLFRKSPFRWAAMLFLCLRERMAQGQPTLLDT